MNDLQKNLNETINERVFKVYSKEVATKDGRTFLVHSTTYNGVYFKLKFKRECERVIAIKGIYDLIIELGDVSVQRGKIKTLDDGREILEPSIIWVSKVKDLRKYTDEELKAKQIESLQEMFK